MLGDLGIYSDHQVLGLGYFLVPGGNLVFQPVGERLPNNAGGHVNDPLLRQLSDLLGDWIVSEAVRVLSKEVFDVLDAEALVLWAEGVVDLGTLDNFKKGLQIISCTYTTACPSRGPA